MTTWLIFFFRKLGEGDPNALYGWLEYTAKGRLQYTVEGRLQSDTKGRLRYSTEGHLQYDTKGTPAFTPEE